MEWIRTHRPRAICLVDYPGFNLRLARQLYREGISVKGGGGPTPLLHQPAGLGLEGAAALRYGPLARQLGSHLSV